MEPKENSIELHGSVWMTVGGENFGNPEKFIDFPQAG